MAVLDAYLLALTTDGVCVANKKHSVLPLFLKVLNFPPSLRVKYFATICFGIVPLSAADLAPKVKNQRPAHLGPYMDFLRRELKDLSPLIKPDTTPVSTCMHAISRAVI